MTLARHRIEIELRRSGDIAAKGRDEDKLGAGRVRRGDPVQPVGARFAAVERHNEADARALVHASLQDLGEPFDRFGERGGVERGDVYGLGFHDLTGERECSAARCISGRITSEMRASTWRPTRARPNCVRRHSLAQSNLPERNGSMSSPHHASIPAWAWAVPLLASALVALKLFHIVPPDDTVRLGSRRSLPRRHGVRRRPSRRGAGAQAWRAFRLDPSRGRGDGDRSRAHCLDHACRGRGQRARRPGHGVRGGDDRPQWRRRPLPRPWGGQALRADLPASGRGLRARRARDFGDAGADPAQLRRGRFRPVLFHSAAGGHRPHVAGPLVRVCVRANRQASRLFPRCPERRRFWARRCTMLPAS